MVSKKLQIVSNYLCNADIIYHALDLYTKERKQFFRKVKGRNLNKPVFVDLMKNENSKNVYKIPFLGEIPLLGAIFRRTENTVTKTELVIFLTPHIISGDENLLDIKS